MRRTSPFFSRFHPFPRQRRGAALITTMMFVGAIGGVAMSSVFLSGNANLVTKSYGKEMELKYAAEAGLALGKARLNSDPAALPDTGFKTLMLNAVIVAADGAPVPGVKVNVYVGRTGSTSGQFGQFASIVAEARDAQGMGFVRRLELAQESFAKFAYWSNKESIPPSRIYFGPDDQLWGPVWSNDVISISGPTPMFNDEVGTAKTIPDSRYGAFKKGFKENQKPINLPSTASLGKLADIATVSVWNFVAPVATGVPGTCVATWTVYAGFPPCMRIEFVAVDLNADGDSSDVDEGFFRVYKSTSRTDIVKGVWSNADLANNLACGDWHRVSVGGPLKFFPGSIHGTPWFKTQMMAGGMSAAVATAEEGATIATIMQHDNARCFLGGDPHLAATSRVAGSQYAQYAWDRIQVGGEDTTFTPTDKWGSWLKYSDAPDANVLAKRPADARYLFPISRLLNSNAKGVIYVSGGPVGISGVVNGRITIYAKAEIYILDDVRYANDPIKGVCQDMLGIISDRDVLIADGSINTPHDPVGLGHGPNQRWLSYDDTKDVYLHAVVMALGSFAVENHDWSARGIVGNGCDDAVNERGCLYLTGGVIQQIRGPVGTSFGQGFIKRYSYDRCAAVTPPPYFPTTGRYTDNRYYEMDPIKFNVRALFRALTPDR